MKPLPADFSVDIPEFTDEELEEERAQCDRENAVRRASLKKGDLSGERVRRNPQE
jgi:hypothetical protein